MLTDLNKISFFHNMLKLGTGMLTTSFQRVIVFVLLVLGNA